MREGKSHSIHNLANSSGGVMPLEKPSFLYGVGEAAEGTEWKKSESGDYNMR